MTKRDLLSCTSPLVRPPMPALKPLRVWLDGHELSRGEYSVDAKGIIHIPNAIGKQVRVEH